MYSPVPHTVVPVAQATEDLQVSLARCVVVHGF